MYWRNNRYQQTLVIGLILSLVLSACVSTFRRPKRGIDKTKEILIDSNSIQEAKDTLAKVVKSESKELKSDSLSLEKDSLGSLTDSLGVVDTLKHDTTRDSLALSDSIKQDSLKKSSLIEDSFDDIIEFSAKDSVVMLGSNLVYLFGESTVDYKDKGIESNFMRMSLDSSLVYAHYTLDSLGRPTAHPKFRDGNEQYEAKTMNYNFKTSKGFITGVVTQQGEGYVTAEKTKKENDECMYMQGGRYTTCQKHEHPHFYLKLTKAKVRNGKNIVAGPSYLVIGDVPLPIGLPFGFFPFTSSYSSGIIMPRYGEETNRGIYLREGGYYWAINDYVDLSLTGDWYSLGSWGLRTHSNYRKRYRFSGSFDLSYIVSKTGDKDIIGDFSESTDFRINWSHSQDPKANPNQNFSASVNYSTSSYNHNSLNTLYNPNLSGQNTKSSSINYSRNFAGTPWRLSASASASQTSSNNSVSLSLPNISVSMSRIYPFKRKKRVGKERWYEKISMSYSGQFQNSITADEKEVFKKSLIKDWRNGISHSIPISASYKLFDYIDLTLSANYKERWYSYKTVKHYNPETDKVEDEKKYGFNRAYDFSTSMSLNTTLYGFYKPWKIFGDKVNMIRHRVTPRIGLSYRPDFGTSAWGFYDHLSYVDKAGVLQERDYSYYDGQIFGSPSRGKSASLNFGFDNNIEAKVKSKTDSIETLKKVSLIDNFSVSSSYNFAADSLRFSDISTRLSLKLSKSFTLSLAANWDPYMYGHKTDKNGRVEWYRVNKLRILNGKGFGALRSTGTSFSYTFNNQTFKKIAKLFGGKSSDDDENDTKKQGSNNTETSVNRPHTSDTSMGDMASKNTGNGSMYGQYDDIEYDADGYEKFTIPWSLSVNYSVSLGRKEFNPSTDEFKYGLTHSLMFSGNIQPTKNWSFNFNASYDFERKRVSNMTLGISRDLHCWSLTASAIPLGPYKSYNFSIGVKSSLLQDLKYDKHSYPTTDTWY